MGNPIMIGKRVKQLAKQKNLNSFRYGKNYGLLRKECA